MVNMSKWKDWRLDALNEQSPKDEKPILEPQDEGSEFDGDILDESFYHLNSEAKLGFSVRQMRKHLTEIEKQFKRTLESGRTDESLVECWTRTYSSLTELDKRLHGLMKSMYRGKKQ
jgi:hypothetical protein